MVTFEDFIKDPIEGVEDPVKFKQYEPQLEQYRKALNHAIKPEYSMELPDTYDSLINQQLNGVEYMYKNKLLTQKEFIITNCNCSELLEKYSNGELCVVEVFNSFAKRATIAHQLTNGAMEIFTEDGLETAKSLDEYYKNTGKLIGPLHGIPMSLKEHLSVKGRIAHSGYVKLIDNITNHDSVTVDICRKLGAVFYIRTNQPQSLMHACSDNNIVGPARCPFNISLTAGGSSSGEGSIVGFGGSVIGIGSDIGGSVRIPAAFCGCFGLKPTSKRVSLMNAARLDTGQESIVATAGPLARTVDDIEYFMKVYNATEPWKVDPDMIRMDWRQVPKPQPKQLKIGVLYDDGVVKPTPPIARGLKETVSKLEASGANIIEFKPIKNDVAFDTIMRLYTADGNAGCKAALGETGEPVKKLTKWFFNMGNGPNAITVKENRRLNSIRNELRQEYTHFMVNNDIDFIISPVYANVAVKPGCAYYHGYTTLFNVLDFPSLTFQTGLFQDPEVDKWEGVEYRNDIEALELSVYDANEYKHAPIALQIAGKRYHDEEVIAAGKAISEVLGVDLCRGGVEE